MEEIQHSATFHPGQDDYDTPYWNDNETVTTPPRISSPEQRQFFTPSVTSPIVTPGAGRSPGIGARSSPLTDPMIYTPSTGSSPSASSPPRTESNPTQLSSPTSAYVGRAGTKLGQKKGTMQPLFEDEVLETKRQSGYTDRMGYVRRAATTVKRKFSRKYRPVGAEDPEHKDLNRALALEDEESRAANEGYGNTPCESLI